MLGTTLVLQSGTTRVQVNLLKSYNHSIWADRKGGLMKVCIDIYTHICVYCSDINIRRYVVRDEYDDNHDNAVDVSSYKNLNMIRHY